MSTIAFPVRPDTRRRSPSASPRTAARGPLARPRPALAPGRVPGAVSCLQEPAARRRVDVLTGLKVALVAAVALAGTVASVVEFASWGEPDPAVEYVAGHPAWAHVSGE